MAHGLSGFLGPVFSYLALVAFQTESVARKLGQPDIAIEKHTPTGFEGLFCKLSVHVRTLVFIPTPLFPFLSHSLIYPAVTSCPEKCH
ncbi:hypothetical protein GE09DRAFT_374567 [Coniochaeta sp. 2T2.1]|nr:hypothetical protein GE09DRAFT_374567 [Coniochaeta sp. 2T2.1]